MANPLEYTRFMSILCTMYEMFHIKVERSIGHILLLTGYRIFYWSSFATSGHEDVSQRANSGLSHHLTIIFQNKMRLDDLKRN